MQKTEVYFLRISHLALEQKYFGYVKIVGTVGKLHQTIEPMVMDVLSARYGSKANLGTSAAWKEIIFKVGV